MPDPESGTPNQAQTAYWNDAAGLTWARLQDRLDIQIEPLGLAAMQVLAPKPGEAIADIGCGCGQTSLQLAERVGADGAVLGLDISAPMLAVARTRIAQGGLKQASVMAADAQIHPFGPASLDGVFSRFGVMFFSDAVAAFANLAAATKSGGRLAFVCWRPLAENPWMLAPMMAAIPLIGMPEPPDPDAPGPFAFADADKVRRILDQSGWTDIQIAPHDQLIGGHDLETAVDVAMQVGPLARMVREQPDKADAVVAAVRSALQRHLVNGKVMMASATWIVSARKD